MVKTLQSTFTAWISTRITPFRLKLLMYVHRMAVCTLPGTLVYIRCAYSRTCVHTVVLFFPGMQGILVPIVDCFTSKCTRISMRFWMTDWFILCTAWCTASITAPQRTSGRMRMVKVRTGDTTTGSVVAVVVVVSDRPTSNRSVTSVGTAVQYSFNPNGDAAAGA